MVLSWVVVSVVNKGAGLRVVCRGGMGAAGAAHGGAAVELAALRLPAASGAVVVVSKDALAVAIAPLPGAQLALLVSGDSGAGSEALLRRTAEDCRDALLAHLGPRVGEWPRTPHKLEAVLSPLVLPLRDALGGAAEEPAESATAEGAVRAAVALSRLLASGSLLHACNLVGAGEASFRAREGWEETLDLVEQSAELGNDTLDEADLCLPVGVALLAQGAVLHSSLCAEDLQDLYRALLVWRTPRAAAVDASGLVVKVAHLWACVSAATGSRAPMVLYARGDPGVVLERRVAAVVALGGVVVARLLVSQSAELHGTGHLDPYGLLAMERALEDLVVQDAVREAGEQHRKELVLLCHRLLRLPLIAVSGADLPAGRSASAPNSPLAGARRRSSSVSSWLSSSPKSARGGGGASQQPSLAGARGRAHSHESLSMWKRLKRVGSGLRLLGGRRRSASMDAPSVPQLGEARDEAAVLDAAIALSESGELQQLLAMGLGVSAREMGLGTLPRPRVLEDDAGPAPYSIADFCLQATGQSLGDIEELFGLRDDEVLAL